jgi:hypothetical protein
MIPKSNGLRYQHPQDRSWKEIIGADKSHQYPTGKANGRDIDLALRTAISGRNIYMMCVSKCIICQLPASFKSNFQISIADSCLMCLLTIFGDSE